MRGSRLVWALAFLALCTGCHPVKIAKRYMGSLYVSNVAGVENFTHETILIRSYQSPKSAMDKVFTIQSTHTGEKILQSVTASNFSYYSFKNTFDLEIPNLRKEPFHLKPVSNSEIRNCYEAQDGFRIELCIDDETLSLEAIAGGERKLYVSASHLETDTPFAFEPPQKLTISRAIQIALQKNAEVLEERENLYRAEQSATGAYAALTPKLNIAPIAGVVTGNPGAALGAVVDFIPFIFPSRWLHAQNEEWQYRAESMANILLKAETATAIHTLAINYINHRAYVAELHQFQSKVDEIYLSSPIFIKHPEATEISKISFQRTILKAEETLEKERMSLAYLIGLNNPSAVADIEDDGENSLDAMTPPLETAELEQMERDYANISIGNSFGVRQLIYLKRAAETKERNLFVNWISPDNKSAQLGLDWFSEINTAESFVRVFNLKINKLQRTLALNAFRTVYELNQNKKYFALNQKDLALKRVRATKPPSEKALAQDSDYVLRKTKRRISAVAGTLEKLYQTRALVLISQAILQRMALVGPYAELTRHFDRSVDDFLPIASPENVKALQPMIE